MASSRRRLAAMVAVAAVGLSACGSPETEAAAADPELVRRTTAPTTGPTPDEDHAAPLATSEEPSDAPTRPEPDDGPDLPTAEGRDWQDVAQKLLDIQTAAYERRDVGLLIQAYRTQCACYDHDRSILNALLDEDVRRAPEGATRISSAELLDDDGDAVTLLLTIERPLRLVTDHQGKQLGVLEAKEATERWTLISDDGSTDGPWRVAIIRPVEG